DKRSEAPLSFRRNKIAIIGAGFTGATTALMLAQKELGDVVLLDLPDVEDPTKGKALDMLEASPIQRFNSKITGTSSYADIADANMVIITAGIPRKPGMSRDDLVNTNTGVMKFVAEQVKQYAPNSIILVLSNPVDAMTYVCQKVTGFPKHRVIGQSGVLDTARFNTFVAEELNISIEDISGFVLGGHGDEMVPLIRYSYAGGIPLELLIPKERLDAIIERTRKGGGEIVALLGNGSAYYAPAAAIVEMAEAIILDKKKILPSITLLNGEYGYQDLFLGVPTILGGNGVESIIELPLTDVEKDGLSISANAVKSVIEICDKAL